VCATTLVASNEIKHAALPSPSGPSSSYSKIATQASLEVSVGVTPLPMILLEPTSDQTRVLRARTPPPLPTSASNRPGFGRQTESAKLSSRLSPSPFQLSVKIQGSTRGPDTLERVISRLIKFSAIYQPRYHYTIDGGEAATSYSNWHWSPCLVFTTRNHGTKSSWQEATPITSN
jgi:hypothetical protein